MALVADIQLQNDSVTPEKIDETGYYTVASLSATNGVFIGPTIPGSLSGLMTLKSANSVSAWLQTTKTDGDVSVYFNNDADPYWKMSLSGAAPPSGGVADSFYLQSGDDPNSPSVVTHLTVQKDGNFGFGTAAPDTGSIVDINAYDSTTANITLKNVTDATTLKMSSESAAISVGSETNHPLQLKVNDTVIGTFSSGGLDLVTGSFYTVNGVQALGGTLDTSKSWPNQVSSSYDAYKISFADLNSVNFTWDWEYAKKSIRGTSWKIELGDMPRYGAFVVDGSQNALQFINRDFETNGVDFFQSYMTFNVGADKVIPSNITDISFKDFKLYICTVSSGLILVDFLEDKIYKYDTSGVHVFNGNISNRNDDVGYTVVNSSITITNNVANAISVVRDPSGIEDIYTRPFHFFALGCGTGSDASSVGALDLYIPDNTAIGTIYSSGTKNVKDVKMLDNGDIWWISDDNTDDILNYLSDFENVIADSFGTHTFSPSGSNGQKLIADTTDDILGVDSFYSGTQDDGVAIFYYAQGNGLYIIHNNNTTPADAGHVIAKSTYTTPYMKGTRVASYPLSSVDDRSGNTNNLTNNGTISFSTSNAPFGNKATLNGSTQYLSVSTSDFASTTNALYAGVWFRSTSTTNPVGEETILHAFDSVGTDNNFRIYYNTSGEIIAEVQDNAATTTTLSSVGDRYDTRWHYVVLQRNTTDNNLELWIDGTLANTASFAAIATNDTDTIYIGTDSGTTKYFAGDISSVVLGKNTYLTKKEIEYEFNRGSQSISNLTTKLSADVIDSINVDYDSGYLVLSSNNVLHVMDALNASIYSTDTISSGTLSSVDIKNMIGSYTPHYLLGGTLNIEQVATNTFYQ